MILILFILVCYGISNIIVYGTIFNGFREWCMNVSPKFLGKITTCMICAPTWVGFIISALSYIFGWTLSPFAITGAWWPVVIFLDGCLSSSTTWLIHTFQELAERAFTYED